MVLIENNQRIVLSPHGDAANSQTETKEALGPLPNLQSQQDNQVDGRQVDKRQGRFRANAGESSSATVPAAATASAVTPTANAHSGAIEAEAQVQTESLVDLARSEWVSTKAKARRQILLVFFLSLSSCLVAVLLFVLFLRTWGKQPTETLAQDSKADSIAIKENGAELQQPSVENDPETDTDGGTPESGDKPDKMPEAETMDPLMEEKEAEVNGEVDVPSGADSDASPSPAVTDAMPATVVDAQPEAGLPAVLPTLTNENNQTQPALGSKESSGKEGAAPELPESLRKLANVFDPSLEMRLGELPGSRVQAGLSTPDIAALPVLSAARLHPPAAPPVELAKKLADEIAGVEIQEKPLAEILELWSQLSGVGIEIRWHEVAAVNVEPSQLISLRQGRTTYQDFLTGVLTPLGLEFSGLDTSIVRVAPLASKVTELLPQSWKISDLITEKSPLAEVERIVRELNPALGESAKFADDEIQWSPPATAFQKFAVLETLEHLRTMRGLPLASSYRPGLFNRAWPDPSSQSASQFVLKETVVKNSPVIQTLSQAAREAEATISVDWVGTWEHGLAPYTEDTFLPRGRSLSGLSEAVAFKYGLEVAWLSSNHLVLTTLPRLKQMEMMVHVELSDQRDVEGLKRRLSRFSTLSAQDLPSIRFAIDPQSEMLLAIIRPLRSDEVSQRP